MFSLLILLIGPAQAQTVIDFDAVPVTCNFSTEDPLRDAYLADGVRFEGPSANAGGAVLDECGNFGISGHSSPNFVAFNSGASLANGGSPSDPETMIFTTPVQSVVFGAGASSGGSLTATAYDSVGSQVDQVVVTLSGTLQSVSLSGASISEVVLDASGSVWVFDDLEFDGQADADGDGYDVAAGDCDDGDPTVFPGALEVCDGVDTDCDGTLLPDELDADGDGVAICEGDCDDADPTTYPGATDICDGGIDNDCDPSTNEASDTDGDGFTGCAGDCDDLEPTVFPGAAEICDGLDNDCDPSTDENADPDFDGVPACADICPSGDDYADADGDTVPDACDPCPQDVYDDSDGDGTCDTDDRCPGSDDFVDGDTDQVPDDCDNCPNTLNPGQYDGDEDGFGQACDCDDEDDLVAPGADELCDSVDNDCDGSVDEDPVDAQEAWRDGDGDGEGDLSSVIQECLIPSDYVTNALDCDDADAAVNTSAVEVCDGIDNNCSGTADDLPDCFDGGAAPKLGGCGCDGTGSVPGAVWGLAVLGLLVRRRRSA